jgi:hypothetical protein
MLGGHWRSFLVPKPCFCTRGRNDVPAGAGSASIARGRELTAPARDVQRISDRDGLSGLQARCWAIVWSPAVVVEPPGLTLALDPLLSQFQAWGARVEELLPIPAPPKIFDVHVSIRDDLGTGAVDPNHNRLRGAVFALEDRYGPAIRRPDRCDGFLKTDFNPQTSDKGAKRHEFAAGIDNRWRCTAPEVDDHKRPAISVGFDVSSRDDERQLSAVR